MRFAQHVPALDGVRGVAALLVFLGHLGDRGWFLAPFFAHDLLGKSGVWLFFALSAFLLTGRLTEELEAASDSRGSIGAYALHRVFRIFPLYVVVIAVHWLLGDFTTSVAVQHLFLMKALGPLWAIPVEVTYYFAIPPIALAAARFGRARTIQLLSAALLAAFLFNLAFPEMVFRNSGFIHGKLVPFFLGSLGGLLALGRSAEVSPSAWRRLVLPGLALAGFALTTALSRERLWLSEFPVRIVEPGFSLAFAVFGTALISVVLEPNWVARVFGSAPLAFFGRISFSLYLWHTPLLAHLPQLDRSPASAWAYFAGIVFTAWVSYRAIERPGIELGRRLGRALRARRLAAAGAA